MGQDRRHKERVRSQFDRQAVSFSRWAVTGNRDYLGRYCDFLGLHRKDRLLDVACGTGEFSLFAAARVGSVTGVDISAGMIARAREQAGGKDAGKVRFLCHDVEEIPLESGSFSIVVCKSAFHHMEDPSPVFREMVRCCEGGGRISVQDILSYEDPEVNLFFEKIERQVDPSHYRTLAAGEVLDLYHRNGLEIIRTAEVEVELDLEEYLAHARQRSAARREVRRLVAEGSRHGRLSPFIIVRGGELGFRRKVLLVLGRRNP